MIKTDELAEMTLLPVDDSLERLLLQSYELVREFRGAIRPDGSADFVVIVDDQEVYKGTLASCEDYLDSIDHE